mgnify:CR=1 FL=1
MLQHHAELKVAVKQAEQRALQRRRKAARPRRPGL